MVNVAKPIDTSRLSTADFKKCCVLNKNVALENLNNVTYKVAKSGGSKKSHSLMRSKRLKKY